MALPSRSNPVTRSLSKVAKVISPTGIGVLLSVGAHVGLLAFGPRTDFSFAALSQAAQQAEAEETIVPLVQLTPAERNRLPSFAQPRKPPTATGLGNLSLPSGLPSVPNTSIPRRTVPANPFPAPTTPRTRTPARTPARLPTRPQTPAPLSRALPSTIPRLQLPTIPSLGLGRRAGIPVVPPANTAPPTTAVIPSQVTPPPADNGSASDLLPQLEGLSVEEALAQTQDQGSDNVAVAPRPRLELPSGDQPGPDDEAAPIPVPPPAIATAPAQGDTTLLIDGNNNYDPTAVSPEEADEREADWLIATAEGKEAVETASSEITINSQFKACREEPPVEGRLGVVVNPDGSQSEATVLKSIGYDVLNRLALRTLEYEDFGTPEVPTQYTVTVNVIYEPDDCTEPLPNTDSEGDSEAESEANSTEDSVEPADESAADDVTDE